MSKFWAVIIIVILAGIGYMIFSDMNSEMEDMSTNSEVMVDSDEPMEVDIPLEANTSGYVDLNDVDFAAATNRVLFFHASWCPTCKSLDTDIRANESDIPSDLTIFKVDYDSFTDLKKQYVVTTQHTLVQVDADGNLIQKWLGSPTLATLLAKVQ